MAFPSSPASRPAAGTDGSHSQPSFAKQMKDSVSKAFQRLLRHPTASSGAVKGDVSSKPRSPDGPQGQGRSEGHNQYIAATDGKRFEEIRIPADGNCLFAAVDKATSRSGDAGTRALLAKHLSDNRDRLTSDKEFQTQLRNCVLDACGAESKGDQPKSDLGLDDLVADVCHRNLDGYVTATREGHPWEGQQGDLTALLLASHLEQPIHIYRPDGATIDLSGKYEPLTKKGRSAEPIRLYGDRTGYWKLTVSEGVPQTADRLKKLNAGDVRLSTPGLSPTDLLTAVDFAVKDSADGLDPAALRRGVADFVHCHRWTLSSNETFQKEFLAALPEAEQRDATGAFLDKYSVYVGTDRAWLSSLADLNIRHLSEVVGRPIIVYADGPVDPKAGGSQPPPLVELDRYQPGPVGGTAAPAGEPIHLSFRGRHYNLLKPAPARVAETRAPAVPTPPPIPNADDGSPDPQQAILRSLRSMSDVFKTILAALDNIVRLLDGSGGGPNEGDSAPDTADGNSSPRQLWPTLTLGAADRWGPLSLGAAVDAGGQDKPVVKRAEPDREIADYWMHKDRDGISPEEVRFSSQQWVKPWERPGEGQPQVLQADRAAGPKPAWPTWPPGASATSGGLFGGRQDGPPISEGGAALRSLDVPNDHPGHGAEDGGAPQSLFSLFQERREPGGVESKGLRGEPVWAETVAEHRTGEGEVSSRAGSPLSEPATVGVVGGAVPAALRSVTPPNGSGDADGLDWHSSLFGAPPIGQAAHAGHFSTPPASPRSADGSQPDQSGQPEQSGDLIKDLQHTGSTLRQVFNELCDAATGTATAMLSAAGGGSAASSDVHALLDDIDRAIGELCHSLHPARDGEAPEPSAGQPGGPVDGGPGWSEIAAADELKELYENEQAVLAALTKLQARLADLDRQDLDEGQRQQIVAELKTLADLVKPLVQAGDDEDARRLNDTAGARRGRRPDG